MNSIGLEDAELESKLKDCFEHPSGCQEDVHLLDATAQLDKL
jgi:hypothetical protein